jgi:hypothetical protein
MPDTIRVLGESSLGPDQRAVGGQVPVTPVLQLTEDVEVAVVAVVPEAVSSITRKRIQRRRRIVRLALLRSSGPAKRPIDGRSVEQTDSYVAKRGGRAAR